MKLRLIISSFVALAIVSSCSLIGVLFPGTWEFLGQAGFSGDTASYVDIAVDENNGIVYVAFQDGSLGSVKVMKYEQYGAETWEEVGMETLTSATADYISIALDEVGTPYVAFSDETTGVDGLTVMSFGGTTWNTVGAAGLTEHSITHTDIAVGGGVIYAVARENLNTGGGNLKVFQNSGSTWTAFGSIPQFSAGSGGEDSVDMVVDSGAVYVVFTDNASGEVTVISSDGNDWSKLGGADVSNGGGEYADMAAHEGTIFVSFVSDASGTVSVRRFDGTAWDDFGNTDLSDGVASTTSIDTFSNGTAVVGYRDWPNNYRLTVQQREDRNSADWSLVGKKAFTEGQVSYVSVDVTESGYYVGFSDDSYSGAVTVLWRRIL